MIVQTTITTKIPKSIKKFISYFLRFRFFFNVGTRITRIAIPRIVVGEILYFAKKVKTGSREGKIILSTNFSRSKRKVIYFPCFGQLSEFVSAVDKASIVFPATVWVKAPTTVAVIPSMVFINCLDTSSINLLAP